MGEVLVESERSELVDESTATLLREAPSLVVKLLHLDGLRPHHITSGNLSRKGLSQEAVVRKDKFEHDAQVVQAVDNTMRQGVLRDDPELAAQYNWYVDNGFAPHAGEFASHEIDLVEKLLDTSEFARIAYEEMPLSDDRLRVELYSGQVAAASSVDTL
jgi:hypothetical protein